MKLVNIYKIGRCFKFVSFLIQRMIF